MKLKVLAGASDQNYFVYLLAEKKYKGEKDFRADWEECYTEVGKLDLASTGRCLWLKNVRRWRYEAQYRLMGKRGWKIKEVPHDFSVVLP